MAVTGYDPTRPTVPRLQFEVVPLDNIGGMEARLDAQIPGLLDTHARFTFDSRDRGIDWARVLCDMMDNVEDRIEGQLQERANAQLRATPTVIRGLNFGTLTAPARAPEPETAARPAFVFQRFTADELTTDAATIARAVFDPVRVSHAPQEFSDAHLRDLENMLNDEALQSRAEELSLRCQRLRDDSGLDVDYDLAERRWTVRRRI